MKVEEICCEKFLLWPILHAAKIKNSAYKPVTVTIIIVTEMLNIL
jgi:hypothetical protein